MILYVIRLPVNDYAVAYIGVTKNLRKRLSLHRAAQSLIGQAIRACGSESIVTEIIEYGDRSIVFLREIELIAKLRTRWPCGYNIAAGGFGGGDWLLRSREKAASAKRGRTLTDDHKQRIAAALRGRTLSESHIAKVAAAQKGRTLPAEARKKISLAFAGKPQSAELIEKRAAANRGAKRSAETRAKISAALTGKRASAETRAKLSAAKLANPVRYWLGKTRSKNPHNTVTS